MSDEPKPKLDVALPIGVTEAGERVVLRLQADSPGTPPTVSLGHLTPAQEGVETGSEQIRLHPTEGPHFRVETVRPKRTMMFPSKAYSEGWERIFGRKPRPEEIN